MSETKETITTSEKTSEKTSEVKEKPVAATAVPSHRKAALFEGKVYMNPGSIDGVLVLTWKGMVVARLKVISGKELQRDSSKPKGPIPCGVWKVNPSDVLVPEQAKLLGEQYPLRKDAEFGLFVGGSRYKYQMGDAGKVLEGVELSEKYHKVWWDLRTHIQAVDKGLRLEIVESAEKYQQELSAALGLLTTQSKWDDSGEEESRS